MFYTLSLFSFVILVVLLAFYKREHIVPLLPTRIAALLPSPRPYNSLPTFESQRAAGLSSINFDIESNNILGADSRAGLDEQGAAEVQAIMQSRGVNFDQARLIRHNQILARNGIDPSGMPLDAKAVTRL
ncbi:hypothetical protein FRC03_010027 [Tulasnella sp. 419]|nr:hypothetical protein FRC03_010027 [Tulasnella sp. 419]